MRYKMKPNTSIVATTSKYKRKDYSGFFVPPITTISYAYGIKDFQRKQQQVIQTIKNAEKAMSKELKSG